MRSAFDVLSGRPPTCPKPSKSGPGIIGNSAGKAGRLYSWYYQHLTPVDRKAHAVSATDLCGNKGRHFLDNAEMACKWSRGLEGGFTVKHKPSTNLKHQLLKSCEGFQEGEHWQDPDVVKALSELASEVLCLIQCVQASRSLRHAQIASRSSASRL
jgi:hypothetical protein